MDIIAHRGASGSAPENTLAAFELAWQQHADGIELDVRLSRDGRVMVHHDADTRRTAGIDLVIADSDSDTLRKLDVGIWKDPRFAGQTMPCLDDVLAIAPADKRILIEIKCGPEIVSALAACDVLRHRIDLISFNLDTLRACRAALPALPCYSVLDIPLAPASELIELARREGFAGLDLNQQGIDGAFAAAVKAAGLELMAWTVNDTTRCRQLRAWGLDAIASDWPLQMREALQEPFL